MLFREEPPATDPSPHRSPAEPAVVPLVGAKVHAKLSAKCATPWYAVVVTAIVDDGAAVDVVFESPDVVVMCRQRWLGLALVVARTGVVEKKNRS